MVIIVRADRYNVQKGGNFEELFLMDACENISYTNLNYKCLEIAFYLVDTKPHHSIQRMRKSTLIRERPAKAKTRLCIRAVWLESSFPVLKTIGSLPIQGPSRNSDQTARMRSLIRVFTGHTVSEDQFSHFPSFFNNLHNIISDALVSIYCAFIKDC